MINVIPHKVDILRNVLSHDTSKSLQLTLFVHANVHLHKRLQEVHVSVLNVIFHSIQIHDKVDLLLFPLPNTTSLLQNVRIA